MDSKDRQIEELKTLVAALTKRVAEPELALAKATKDSSTSSKPSSSYLVMPKPKKGPGRPKSKKLGAQPGHQRNLREPLPPERVDETFVYEIDSIEIDSIEIDSIEIQRLGLTPTGDIVPVIHDSRDPTPKAIAGAIAKLPIDETGSVTVATYRRKPIPGGRFALPSDTW